MEETRLLVHTVEDLVRSGELELLRRALEPQSAEDLADLLEHAGPEVRDAVFAALGPGQQGEVAVLVDEAVREDLLEDIPAQQLAEIVQPLEPADAVTILEDADPDVADAVLGRLDPEEAEEVRQLLGYDEDSAGRAMEFGAPAVHQDSTLGAALEQLRGAADELDEIQAVYVVDTIGRLRGYVPLHVLIVRPPDTPVIDVMRSDLIFAYVDDDQEMAATRARRSGLASIPIVDSRGVLRGQIARDRLREIEEEEASEDMYRMVGLSEDDSVYSPVGFSLRRRLPWLLVNLGTAFLAAGVVSLFKGTIEKFAVLAVLQSVVAGQGGNAGIQTLTIVVRALALGDLDWRNSGRIFFKELAVGFCNGLGVGALVGIAVYVWQHNLVLSCVIAAAMALNMVVAALSGFTIPLFLRALRLDPALASGVFVTMMTDVCGFLFFLGLATLLMPWLTLG